MNDLADNGHFRLLADLSSEDPAVRKAACVMLTDVEPPWQESAIQALTGALGDPDGNVRSAAAVGLRKLLPDGSEAFRTPAPDGRTVFAHSVATAPRFPRQLSVPVPRGWSAKDSVTVVTDDGEANVIFSSEPLDPSVTAQDYGLAQVQWISSEFAGYEQLESGAAEAFGGRHAWKHVFSWWSPDGGEVTQLQIYYAEAGRGYTATATATPDVFSRRAAECGAIVDALRLVSDRSGGWSGTPRRYWIAAAIGLAIVVILIASGALR